MPRKTGKIVKVTTLCVGDLVAQDDGAHYQEERYVVEIIDKSSSKDRFHPHLLRFKVRIVAGPDRVGEVGNMDLGPEGVVRRIGRSV